MAALEALSAGLPVCVSDRVVGLPATVKQARWDDVEAWTAAVREMLPIRRKHLLSVPRLQNMRLSKSSSGGKPSTNRSMT